MDIRLPDLTIQPDWTAESQLVKITEEFEEVKEAIGNQDPINVVREALDVMQTCNTLIEIQRREYHLNINKFMVEHFNKLRKKGYME